MPQRIRVIRVDASAVQGDDAFVMVRAVTRADAKKLQTLALSEDVAAIQAASDPLIIEYVVDWNWVDDEGVALPIPKDDPKVIDRLLEREVNFLGEAIGGTMEAPKES